MDSALNSESNSRFRFGLDVLTVREDRLFGWGWAADAATEVAAVALVVMTERNERVVNCALGGYRPDVADACPELRNSGNSGFSIVGFAPGANRARFRLDIDLRDGRRGSFDVSPTDPISAPAATACATWTRNLRGVWRYLRRADLAGLWRKARQLGLGRQRFNAKSAAEIVKLAGDAPLTLVFDHAMGGGANQYRTRFCAERIAAGECVVQCTYHLASLDYEICATRRNRSCVFRADSFLALEALLGEMPGLTCFVNSPVSFHDPLSLARWLALERKADRIGKLVLTAHDHFPICPSFVLLNAEGRFCGVPDTKLCDPCLASHRAQYVQFSPRVPITTWRATWSACLAAADEVLFFSEATRTLFERAFPPQILLKAIIRPHHMPALALRALALDHRAELRIGIVGQISTYKGADVVVEMLKCADRLGVPVKFVVFGSLERSPDSPRLTVTGPYQRERLPEMIAASGANLFVFPSICPETFSYVVEELMQLGLPVVAFDLGAQGAKIREYRYGRLAKSITGQALLEAALAFHDELSPDQVASKI